ncbi:MAG: hypothetical protein JXA57_06600 [Armatimonadetes bacterium]|nr:hypothetical protein [Armatimonadota bacterium]
MITAKPLKFDEECSRLLVAAASAEAEGDLASARNLREQWAAKVQSATKALLSSEGFELVLAGMRVIVSQALQQIAAGTRPEFHAGQISAIEDIRTRLREWTNTVEILEAYDEGLS